ncbi:hypothetical protein ABZ477_08030 [Microbacterium sp. NPDC019599]|uniref:hypothetical protein n=1 Tax=Microbacterium sp. NPDC019599 TaxID=3154690 RepID=UPI003400C96D
MNRRRSPATARGIPLLLAAGLLLAGCAPTPSPDPALVALSADALSATRSAELGTGLREDGRMFTTTARALLGDMEQKLADALREAELHRPADAEDAAYRDELIAATLEALDAVQAAVAEQPGALDELDAAAEQLEGLEGAP